MPRYLSAVKAKVDVIVAAGMLLENKSIILYTLNGLPSNYQAFKTAIRKKLQPLSLDDLYTCLCSENLNLAHEAAKDL